MMSESDMCAQFMSFTGTSATEALNWLEMAGFELQDAISLYFNSQGVEERVTQLPAQKESYDDRFGYEEDEIRRPDQVKRQKLVDTDAYLENQVVKKITSAFSSGKGSKPLSEKEKTLSTLFKAPTDIMTQTSFDEAKEIAKSENKWLLVNIQRDSEFQSHALNRDFWSDECVKDMVQCSFVFWQKLDVTPEGSTYVQYYKVVNFPHIAIVDPRTGACKWQYQPAALLDTKRLAEKIQDFLGDNPSPAESRFKPGRGHPGTNAASASSSGSAVSDGGSGSTGDGAMTAATGLTEEEEMERAIQMSLLQQSEPSESREIASSAAAASAPVEPSASKDRAAAGLVGGTVFGWAGAGTKKQEKQAGFCAAEVLQAVLPGDEGATGSGSGSGSGSAVRAQIRLPSGAKGVEKFSTTEDVQRLVQVVAKLVPAADANRRFDVLFNFPRVSLSDQLSAIRQERGEESSGVVTFEDVGVTADTVFNITFL